MLVAEIVYPKKLKRKAIKCCECGLTYRKDEYPALFEGFKLKFFKIKDIEGGRVVCHDCLFETLKQISFGKPVQFGILAKENEYLIEFYPEDYFDGFLDSEERPTYSKEDSMEDFLRDLE